MSDPAIAYRPRPDATPEDELDILAAVYRFVLDSGEVRRAEETKKGTRPGAPDARKESNGSGKVSIPN